MAEDLLHTAEAAGTDVQLRRLGLMAAQLTVQVHLQAAHDTQLFACKYAYTSMCWCDGPSSCTGSHLTM